VAVFGVTPMFRFGADPCTVCCRFIQKKTNDSYLRLQRLQLCEHFSIAFVDHSLQHLSCKLYAAIAPQAGIHNQYHCQTFDTHISQWN
jgi:hypothetical protein